MLLRPRQKELVDRTVSALKEHNNTLAVAPTGAGKTIMLSAVIGEFLRQKQGKACVLAHRDELTDQNQAKFKRVNPDITTSVFNASIKSWDGAVTFAMVQTLARENNLQAMPPMDLLVIDEAHHARAKSYMEIIQYIKNKNPEIKILGMTATPNRGDKKGLRPIFSNVADQITIKELINSGHLVPPKTFVIDLGVQKELKEIKKRIGDFDMNAVSELINTRPINSAVVKHWKEKAGDRQTIVFCSTIEHAISIQKSFIKAGIYAVVVSGHMTSFDRDVLLAEYKNGAAQVIINVAILTEGWDHPPTSCVILLRPSSYKSTMIQMIGRGLRIVDPAEHPGIIKKNCIVLDFGISTLLHGSLEQDVNLDDQVCHDEDNVKFCPECEAKVPIRIKECPLCGYEWDIFTENKKELLHDFKIIEIDLFRNSHFLWVDLKDNDKYFIAAGFNAWGGVFLHEETWYAIGGMPKQPPKLLAVGERIVCFSAANDWLNKHETDKSAYKSKKWIKEPATDKQLQYLPEHKNDFGLTRYKASALLTMRFNREGILKAIKSANDRSH